MTMSQEPLRRVALLINFTGVKTSVHVERKVVMWLANFNTILVLKLYPQICVSTLWFF